VVCRPDEHDSPAQRAGHYEIGAYRACIAWASAMGHNQVVQVLTQRLNEEKAATFGMEEEEEEMPVRNGQRASASR
jgi:ferritin-like metal-binding protein YciE